MKKIVLVCAYIMLFMMCGGVSLRSAVQSTSDAPIYDLHNNIIGEIKPDFENFIAMDDGFVYSESSNNTTDYYRYFFDGNKSEKLYSLDGDVQQSSNTVLINKQLYFLVSNTTGSDGNYTLYLMDLDRDKNEMKPISKDENMYPGSFLCIESAGAVNPDLLILKKHVDSTELIKYVPETGDATNVLQSVFDNAKSSGDTIEAVYCKWGITTLLMLQKNRSLWMDSYKDNGLLGSVNVSVFSDFAGQSHKTVDSLFYDYTNNYVYYQNSSGSSYLGRNLDGKLKRSINNTILKAKNTIEDRDEAVFFDNRYLYDFKEGTPGIMRKSWLDINTGYRVENVYISGSDNILICTVKASIFSSKIEREFYYLKFSDFDFDQRVKLR